MRATIRLRAYVKSDGTVLNYFDSRVTPESPQLNEAIVALFGAAPATDAK